MSDFYSDVYWTEEFEITTADLDRIAAHISETGRAYDLTELAKRVVRGRLCFGPETSAPAQRAWAEDSSVRSWDPAGKWKVGDHVIVAVGFPGEGHTRHKPLVGEIVIIEPHRVRVQIDAIREARVYSTRARRQDDLQKWRQFVEDLVESRRGVPDEETQVEFVILKHGERVVSQLLDALHADQRFVRLAGRWFLQELAVLPTREQVTALAWAMISPEGPQPTEALASFAQPPLTEGDPGLFGLYLAMRQRSDLFANADPGQRPRWLLAGPPPGSFTPRHAAYDPETYQVLCLPEQAASPEVVQRLWELDLLPAVM